MKKSLTCFDAVVYDGERNPMLKHLPSAEMGKPSTDRELMTRDGTRHRFAMYLARKGYGTFEGAYTIGSMVRRIIS